MYWKLTYTKLAHHSICKHLQGLIVLPHEGVPHEGVSHEGVPHEGVPHEGIPRRFV